MNIGIIGAGAIAQAIAQQIVRAGLRVTLSNRRGGDSLREITQQLGPHAKAGSVQEAAAADIVILAVQWQQIPDAVKDLPQWNNRIVIDTTNPIIQPGFRIAELGGRSSSEVVADLLPGARLVKSLNTLTPPVLAKDTREAGGQRVMWLSGDDADAKATVAGLLSRFGFAPIDLGALATGGRLQQFPGGPLPTLNLVKLS